MKPLTLPQIVRRLLLQVAHREGWQSFDCRVHHNPKTRTLTINSSLSSQDRDISNKLRAVILAEMDRLRGHQSPEAQALWPEVIIKHPLVMIGASYTGTSTVTSEES